MEAHLIWADQLLLQRCSRFNNSTNSSTRSLLCTDNRAKDLSLHLCLPHHKATQVSSQSQADCLLFRPCSSCPKKLWLTLSSLTCNKRPLKLLVMQHHPLLPSHLSILDLTVKSSGAMEEEEEEEGA